MDFFQHPVVHILHDYVASCSQYVVFSFVSQIANKVIVSSYILCKDGIGWYKNRTVKGMLYGDLQVLSLDNSHNKF